MRNGADSSSADSSPERRGSSGKECGNGKSLDNKHLSKRLHKETARASIDEHVQVTNLREIRDNKKNDKAKGRG
jgi:hypothetical protein